MGASEKQQILSALRSQIMTMEGFRSQGISPVSAGLGPILQALPNKTFPVGAVHEFLSDMMENSTASIGFASGIFGHVLGDKGTGVWISHGQRTIYPPGLRSYGIDPDRIIFIDLKNEFDVLWTLNETLKCGAVKAVVGEIRNLPFIISRKLQLSVEESQCTAFIIRRSQRPNITACVSRWRVSIMPGETIEDLPGLGYPTWKVELLKIRNGKPGAWKVCWKNGEFETQAIPGNPNQWYDQQARKAG